MENLYVDFVNNMLDSRTMITINDMKDALLSNELKHKVFSIEEGSSLSMFVGRDKLHDKEGGSREKYVTCLELV